MKSSEADHEWKEKRESQAHIERIRVIDWQ